MEVVRKDEGLKYYKNVSQKAEILDLSSIKITCVDFPHLSTPSNTISAPRFILNHCIINNNDNNKFLASGT